MSTDREGISRWRQIGQTLSDEIERGVIPAGKRLPTSADLAARFGVNRHTVLRALGHLQAAGMVRMQRGRGTYAVANPLQLPLGARRWFEENLARSRHTPTRRVLSVATLLAPEPIAAALEIAPGDTVAFVKLLGEADAVPVTLVSNYFPADRLPGIDQVFQRFGPGPTGALSFGAIFQSFGIADFRRRSVRIRSRPPSGDEAHHLQMASGDHVLETDVVLADPADRPLTYATTAYPSSRVEFVLEL